MAGTRGRKRLLSGLAATLVALLMMSALPGLALANVSLQGSAAANPAVAAPAPVKVTFYKEICPNYSDVPANGNPGNLDATRGHSADLNTSYGTQATGHIVSPSNDIPAACAATSGWSFYFTNSGGTATTGGPFTTGADGTVTVTLNDDQLALAQGGTGLWVREATSDSASFGSIRCYNDVLNGDNLEQMTRIGSTTQLYCIAYNVRQVITFGPLADKTYGDAPITLSATATSGLPVSFTASGQCSLSGATLTITGVGSCAVTASQAGRTTNPFWSPAIPVIWSFDINPVPLTVTAANASRAFGAADPAFTYGTNPSVSLTTPAICTSTATASSPVGTYPITCSGGALANYNISYVAGTLTITPAALTVTANDASRMVGAADPAFTYGTNPSVSLTTPAICTSTATASSPVGTYPITCSGGALANYNISYVAGTLTVNVATATPTQEIGGASATPSTSASQSQSLLGVTSAPNATPPATNAASSGSGEGGVPIFALLVALAFGSLAALMVEKQRRTIRN